MYKLTCSVFLVFLVAIAGCQSRPARPVVNVSVVDSVSRPTQPPESLATSPTSETQFRLPDDDFGGSIDDFIVTDSSQLLNYTAKTFKDTVTGRSFAAIVDGKSQIAGLATEPDVGNGAGTWFTVDSILGPGTRQFILGAYTGGAHCCYLYTIVDLADTARVIYDDSHYTDLVFDLTLQDLDGDGIKEIVRSVGLFDYFLTSHADSPFPVVVLKYSPDRGRYIPEPKMFPGFSQHFIDSLIAECTKYESHPNWEATADCRERCAAPIMGVLLQYIYAGRQEEGWRFYNDHYHATDRDSVRTLIQRRLDASPAYRETYSQ